MSDINLELSASTAKTLSYTYHRLNRPLVHEIGIKNIGAEETTGLKVRPRIRIPVNFDGEIHEVVETWEGPSHALARPRTLQEDNSQDIEWETVWNPPKLSPNSLLLGNLTQTVITQIVVEIIDDDDNVVAEEHKELTLLSSKDWIFDLEYPDSLSAFVRPDSEVVESILLDARKWLKELTGSGQITGSQDLKGNRFDNTDDWFRVDQIAEAIYETIRSRNISYTFPEVSDWHRTQRIRTPEDVLEKDLAGTCLDTTVLYAACLLEAHLSPVIYLVEGHAFCGYAVDEKMAGPLVRSLLAPEEVISSLDKFQAVETTTMCDGGKSFAEACEWQYMNEDLGNSGFLSIYREKITGLIHLRTAKIAGYLSPLSMDTTAFKVPTEETSTADLLQSGDEGRLVEYKSTARWNIHELRKDKQMEDNIVKAVAGFSNAEGGTLLIGVGDDGQLLGLDKDYELVKPSNSDGYINWLDSLLENTLTHSIAQRIKTRIDEIESMDVCRVDVPASTKPVWVHKDGINVLFLRRNNSTRKLPEEEIEAFIDERFPENGLEKQEKGDEFESEDFSRNDLVPLDIQEQDESGMTPRIKTWLNGLLDLGFRNPLLKMKTGSKLCDFRLPPSVLEKIDDDLFDGKRLKIQSPSELPREWWNQGITLATFASELDTFESPLFFPEFSKVNSVGNEVERLIKLRDKDESQVSRKEVKQWKELQPEPYSPSLTDADIEHLVTTSISKTWDEELKKSMEKLKTESTDQMLRTGSNSLFLVLGALTWTEVDERNNKSIWNAPLYLYPVLLEGGKGTPYTIRLDQHGAIVPNYCLREKLIREPIGLDLPELEFPETDDSGIDVEANLKSIEANIRNLKLTNFSVERICRLGVFDYSDFLLWRDLKNDWEEMRDTSPAVQYMMYNPEHPFPEERYDEEKLHADEKLEPHLPHPADDSQIEAIKWALAGKSFRLEGPPGTGKTQTITNLIASCLAHKKKILFVAEKSEALQQVKERLYEVGLGNFCLELHAKGDSDTRIRQNIVEQLTVAVGANADPQDRKWKDLSRDNSVKELFLDEYVKALHSEDGAPFSVWQTNEELIDIGDGEEIIPTSNYINQYEKHEPDFREVTDFFDERIRNAGGLRGHRWRFVDGSVEMPLSSENKKDLSEVLDKLKEVLEEFNSLQGEWKFFHSFNDIIEIKQALNGIELSASQNLPSREELALMGGKTWITASEEIIRESTEISDEISSVFSDIHPSVFQREDINDLIELSELAYNANIFTKRKKRKNLLLALDTDVKSKDAKQVHSSMMQCVKVAPRVAELQGRFINELGLKPGRELLLVGPEADYEVREYLYRIASLAEEGKSQALNDFLDYLATGKSVGVLQKNIIEKVFSQWEELCKIIPYTKESLQKWVAGRPLIDAWLEDQEKWIEDGINNRYLELDRWLNVIELVDKLNDCELPDLREMLLDGVLTALEMREQVNRGFLRTVLKEQMQAGNLDRFDRKIHELHIRQLEDLQVEIRKFMHERVPGMVIGRKQKLAVNPKSPIGEQGALLNSLKQVRKSARKPIRNLIEQFGETLAEAMPCFLMSPETVATLVPVGSIVFDLVIFDEASQVRTSHAIGALGRGKANIVVGDSRQMPPSKHIGSTNEGRTVEADDITEADDLSENEDYFESSSDPLADLLPTPRAAEDAESILQEFEASDLPYMPLLCHYRSKDEILIAFSNSEIYSENPMMTFPSIEGGNSKALKWVSVSNGQFHRPQTEILDLEPDQREAAERVTSATSIKNLRGTNPLEAEAVVEEVWKRLNDPDRQKRRKSGAREGAESIIVVTFNAPQRDLIKALLEKKEGESAGLVSRAFKEIKDEENGVLLERPQLKVINLESVQGAEAETVMFSTAFTKKGAGHANPDDPAVPAQWGPVSDPGGYRRLNVAITRAKKEMMVFCSFDPKDMRIKPTSPRDIKLVQKFLEFAKNPQGSASIGVSVSRSAHIAHLAEKIKEMGYRVDTQVGMSGMRVDVAVARHDSKKWEMAVLLDGPDWADRGSAVQREILPKIMLKSLGWEKVIRVWLPSWIDERKAVLETIRSGMEGEDEDFDYYEIDEEGSPIKEKSDQGKTDIEDSDVDSIKQFDPVNTTSRYTQQFMSFCIENNVTMTRPFEAFEETLRSSSWTEEEIAEYIERESADYTPPIHPDLTWDPRSALFKKLMNKAVEIVLENEAPIESGRFAIQVYCLYMNYQFSALDYKPPLNDRKFILQYFSPDPSRQTTDEFGTFFWDSANQIKTWSDYRPSETKHRTYREIHPREYLNCLRHLLEIGNSLEKEEALKCLKEQFGFTSLTKKLREHLEKVIKYGVDKGELVIINDRIRLSAEG